MRLDIKNVLNAWGTCAALVIALGSAIVSIIAVHFSKRAAKASERQADAAEAQARAIPSQLAAAEASAEAAKRQADIALQAAQEAKKIASLSEAHIKASLQPVLVFERRPPSLRDPIDFIVNAGDGVAMNVRAHYGTMIPPASIQLPNTLASRADARTRVDWSRVQIETIYILYESQDGRKFRTHVGVDQFWHPTHNHEQLP